MAGAAGPRPAALAAEPAGEAVRAWGRLGYPRRALRLHAAATEIVSSHDGSVPSSYDDLIALPGVGDYTAAAIASFAFGRRHVVLDTNVRRVLARTLVGTASSPAASVTRPSAACAACSPDDEPTAGDLVGRGHGARRGGVLAGATPLRRLPGRRPVRVAGRRLPGLRRTAPPGQT